MKFILFFVLVFLSLDIFSNDQILTTDGMRELSKNEIRSVYDALVLANNGKTRYGACHLDWLIINSNIKVYVNENNLSPLILAISEAKWVKFSTDKFSSQIKAINYGDYIWSNANIGTEEKPVFKIIKIITTNSNCLDR